MKIAITGHSKGIGQALTNHFESQGHTVLGFSRINGWDINTHSEKIVEESLDCDVFINNAYYSFKQIDIFNMLFEKWALLENKTIINMGSKIKYANFPGISQAGKDYMMVKKELDKVSKKAMFTTSNRKCRVLSINPGFVATDMLNMVTDDTAKLNHISVGDVVDVIDWMLKFPPHIEVGEIGIWANYTP
jgi:NADP-dependent 3-hydroxy acid dehydrogenase YdfG